MHEVRRFYPFFPFVAARVRDDFEWRGYPFPRGRLVLLDVFGTHHDARIWDEPEAFRPERFLDWDQSPFSFIPPGPGDPLRNHRCPGEGIASALMKGAATFLTREVTYHVPEQDLRITRSRLPALPRNRFIMRDVRLSRGEGS